MKLSRRRLGTVLWYYFKTVETFVILCPYHVISYHIISYHIISYHIINQPLPSRIIFWSPSLLTAINSTYSRCAGWEEESKETRKISKKHGTLGPGASILHIPMILMLFVFLAALGGLWWFIIRTYRHDQACIIMHTTICCLHKLPILGRTIAIRPCGGFQYRMCELFASIWKTEEEDEEAMPAP